MSCGCCAGASWASSGSWSGCTSSGGGGVTGGLGVLRIPFGAGNTTIDSATLLPAGAYVVRTDVQIVSPYSPGPGCTIIVGQAAGDDIFQAAPSNNPAGPAGSLFSSFPQAVAALAVAAVRVTVAGNGLVGASGVAWVHYTVPGV